MLVQLDLEIIRTHGYSKLEEAIKLQNALHSEKMCVNCKTKVSIQFYYRSHLFVECIGASNVSYELKSFPSSVTLNKLTYTLTGIIYFHPGHAMRVAVRYSAFAKYGDSWVHFDGLCTKSKRVTEIEKINPVLCIYVATE